MALRLWGKGGFSLPFDTETNLSKKKTKSNTMKRKGPACDDTALPPAKKSTGTLTTTTPEGAALVEMVGRVYHKRIVGDKLFFFDCATVFDNNNARLETADDVSFGLVEVCVSGETFCDRERLGKVANGHVYATPKNIKLGDVLCIKGYVDTASQQPKAPKTALIKALDFVILEPWDVANKFHSQMELNPARRNLFTWSWAHINAFISPVALPYALLQCNFHVAERLCQYFGVHDSSNYTKCRILHVNHTNNAFSHGGGEASPWATFLRGSLVDAEEHFTQKYGGGAGVETRGAHIPLYLHSNIQRVQFVTVRRPFVSLGEVVALLKVHYALLAAELEKDTTGDDAALRLAEEDKKYRLQRLVTFPRLLETKIKREFDNTIGEKARLQEVEMLTAEHTKLHKKSPSTTPPTPILQTPDQKGHAAMMEAKRTSPAWGLSTYSSTGTTATAPTLDTTAYYTDLIKEALGRRETLFGSTRYEAHDQVCLSEGVYWVGLSVPRLVIPECRVTVPSGAYWKLQEIRDRYLSTPERIAQYSNRSVSVDIGASPGGWSYCSAKDFNTRCCYAVDPAEEYHTLLDDISFAEAEVDQATKNIVAHQTRCNDATPLPEMQKRILKYQQKGQEFIEGTLVKEGVKVGLYVCDINDHLDRAVEMAERVYKAGLFERPALVVLTFKNTLRSKGRFNEAKEKAIERLRSWLSNLTEIHLFANTQLETTVVGEVL